MKVKTNGIEINCVIEGPEDALPIVMSHSLASSHRMWDLQMPALPQYRVYRFDTRGHGNSDAPDGPYTLDQIADDTKGMLDALGLDKVHFVGLSLGGMIGQYLGLRYPEVLLSLTLADTTSHQEEAGKPVWQERIDTAREHGMGALINPTIVRWFTDDFIAANQNFVRFLQECIGSTPVQGYTGAIQAIMHIDVMDQLKSVNVPTLVVVGEGDMSTPVASAQAIHEAIAGSELLVIPTAKHFANVEQSRIFNDALTRFLSQKG